MGNKLVEGLSALTTKAYEVTTEIVVMDFTVVNACLLNDCVEFDNWVLIDTGLENSADFIIETAENKFGKNNRPKAIILTHGHFDHVGSVIKLSDEWDVPVYIHQLEMPYVTGEKDYPLGDSSVDKGFIAKMSKTFPHTSINIRSRIVALPSDGSIPGISNWKWIHTPGHTDGHISLFQEKNRILIVGDAFCTTKQESLFSVITHRHKISGPPKYLTTDWNVAEESIRQLRDLEPSLAITSHGKPLEGEELVKHLNLLVYDFEKIAKPE